MQSQHQEQDQNEMSRGKIVAPVYLYLLQLVKEHEQKEQLDHESSNVQEGIYQGTRR